LVEDDAALHLRECIRWVREKPSRDGYPLNFIVQALQGALAKLSASNEEATVITLPRPE